LLVVIMDIATTNQSLRNISGLANPNFETVFINPGNSWNIATGFGGTTFGSRVHGVTMIETLTPSGGGGGGTSTLIASSLLNSPLLQGRLVG